MNEHVKEIDANSDDLIEKVRRRAYSIWLDEGAVHGRDHEHWRQAEQEVAKEMESNIPTRDTIVPLKSDPSMKSPVDAKADVKGVAGSKGIV